jgi:Tfp pilus assembly protein FimT
VRNALELARGLALSQRQILTVCTVNALNSCVSTGGLRLLVFFDLDLDLDLDLSNGFNAGDNLHQDLDINSIALKMSASFSRPYMRFARNGEALESGNLEVCSTNQSVDYGRQVIVFRSGRIRLSSDSDGDGFDDSGGTKIECPSS